MLSTFPRLSLHLLVLDSDCILIGYLEATGCLLSYLSRCVTNIVLGDCDGCELPAVVGAAKETFTSRVGAYTDPTPCLSPTVFKFVKRRGEAGGATGKLKEGNQVRTGVVNEGG